MNFTFRIEGRVEYGFSISLKEMLNLCHPTGRRSTIVKKSMASYASIKLPCVLQTSVTCI